jgi:Leucine-rich repeat (LRR) protein
MPTRPAGGSGCLLVITALAVLQTACFTSLSYEELTSGRVPNQPGRKSYRCTHGFSLYETVIRDCQLSAAANGCTALGVLEGNLDAGTASTCTLANCDAVSAPSGNCTQIASAALRAPAAGWRQALAAWSRRLPGPPVRPLTVTAIPATERTALIAFHDALGGDTWFTRTNWKGAAGTECTWYGVRCNAAGTAVTGLVFTQSNNLHGSLPASLAGLSQLDRLILTNNDQIVGALPPAIGGLSKLKTLELKGLGITGPLPAQIANLGQLEVIALTGLNLSGNLTALDHLPALRALQIVSVPFTGNLTGISGLSKLEVLDLSETSLAGPLPSELGSLRNLQALTLAFNDFSGTLPTTLGGLTNLTSLRLIGNKLTGAVPSSLGSLTKLVHLELFQNGLSGALPASLAGLTRLHTLALTANRFTGPLPSLAGMRDLSSLTLANLTLGTPFPAEILGLTKLQVLYLQQTGFTGSMPNLAPLTQLVEVSLSDNDFTPGAFPTWASTLPKLTAISLAGTGLTGALPDLSSRAATLRTLMLGRNAFTAGSVPAWLDNMTALRILDIEATQRTGTLPDFLVDDATPLVWLDLSDNPFTPGPIPTAFAQQFDLTSMDLGNTRRTGAIPAFGAADGNGTYLQRLLLDDNQLTGPIGESLSDPYWEVLDLSRNQLTGPIPEDFGSEGFHSLLLSGNKLSGPVPADLMDLDEVITPSYVDPFGVTQVGFDFRFNQLTVPGAALQSFVNARHKTGINVLATQTVPPGGGKATALSATQIKVTWTAPVYKGAGSIKIFRATAAAGPFTLVGTVTNKAVATFTAAGLKTKTTYYFRLQATTDAHAGNPNALVSAQGAVFSAKTK